MNAKEEVDQKIQSIVQGYWKDKNKLMEAIEWIGKNDYFIAEGLYEISVSYEDKIFYAPSVVGSIFLNSIQQRFEEMAGDEIGD